MSADEERLMQLFQNRAGLKKAYADLKDEFHLLRDRLKQQEGATIRVQEQLDALGDLLADPSTGFSAWCSSSCAVCGRPAISSCPASRPISPSRKRRARPRSTRPTARRPGARVWPMSIARLQAAAAEADLQRQHLAAAQTELGRLTAFWHYFERRRRKSPSRPCARPSCSPTRPSGDLHAERSTIGNEALDEFPGISLAARRTINLAIISYAELLCESVDAFGLAARAKEAVARRVHEMSFGARAECEDYMQRVQKAQAAVASQKQITAVVKAKTGTAARHLRIPQFADTVPTADSLAPRATSRPAGSARRPLERPGRGLLGPLHPAAALAARSSLCGLAYAVPASASVCLRALRHGRKIGGDLRRLIQHDARGGIVLDLLQRLRRACRRAPRARHSRAASRSASCRLRSASRVFRFNDKVFWLRMASSAAMSSCR